MKAEMCGLTVPGEKPSLEGKTSQARQDCALKSDSAVRGVDGERRWETSGDGPLRCQPGPHQWDLLNDSPLAKGVDHGNKYGKQCLKSINLEAI